MLTRDTDIGICPSVCQSVLYCIQADDISALFLAMTHEGALLLTADQPPFL